MSEIRWELYPLVAVHERSRAWLQLQSHLQLAPTTLDAYGRSLNDFLAFCQRCEIVPETITREQVALYVQDLAHRPNPKGAKVLSIEGGRGLSNSTRAFPCRNSAHGTASREGSPHSTQLRLGRGRAVRLVGTLR